MKRFFVLILSLLLVMTSFLAFIPVSADDEDLDDDFEVPPLTYISFDVNGDNLKRDESLELNNTVNLPSSYNLVTEGYVTPVKHQGSYGICWTFSAAASAESTYLKETGIALDLSELQLGYYGFHAYEEMDEMDLITDDGAEAYDDPDLLDYDDLFASYNIGGNDYYSAVLLSSGIGFVSENTLPYSQAMNMTNSSVDCYESEYVLVDFKQYSMAFSERDYLKEALMTYGAVSASFYYDELYFNDDNDAYYSNLYTYTNHAITIVGWDDDYPAANFLNAPQDDGAWIVKNSWGPTWGDNGYFYISYYDTGLNASNRVACQYFIEPASDNYYVYQYDGSFNSGNISLSFTGQPLYEANVFTSQQDEHLNSVSFWTKMADEDIIVKVYKNVIDDPVSGTLVLSQNVHMDNAGYHTVVLSEAVSLSEDEKFAVVVSHTKSGASMEVEVDICSARDNESYISYSSGALSQSFVSMDGSNWTDLYSLGNPACSRVKAFTSTCNHDYDMDNPVWDWTDDYSSATATFTCQNNSNHKLVLNAEVSKEVTKAQTQTEIGTVVYTAAVTYDSVNYSDTQTETLNMIASDNEIIGFYRDGNINYLLYGDYCLTINGSGCFNSNISSFVPAVYLPYITSVYFADGFTFISQGTLSSLTNPVTLTLPKSIESIAANVISENITSIDYMGSLSMWNLISIDESNELPSIIICHAFDITYVLDGGSNDQENPSVYCFEEDGEITLNNPGKDGYIFAGWYLDEEYENAIDTLDEDITCDIALYAKWTVDESYYWSHVNKNTAHLVVPEGVTSIPQEAFKNCTAIESIELPNSLLSIGMYAFQNCTSLTSICIPEAVNAIGAYAFAGCTGLETVTVDEDNETFDSRDNCNAIILTADNCLMFGFKTTTFSTTVTSIYDYAMSYNQCPSRVVLPDTITSIGNRIFANSTQLEEIILSDAITEIPFDAFFHCNSLEKVIIPDSVTSIQSAAFLGCTSLETLYIPSSVTLIAATYVSMAPFYDCNNLTIYTGASLKPSQWGTYWNFDSEEHCLDVYYGLTYEEYEDSLLKHYNISFVGNGGSGTMETERYSEKDVFPDCAFNKKGYTFIGWNTETDGSGITYEAGEVIGNKITEESFVLYANWEITSYTIALNSNGGRLASKQSYGICSDEDEDGIYEGIYTILSSSYKLPTLTKDYYKFIGWIDTETSKTVTSINKGSIGNRILMASFSPINYKITYNTVSGKLASISTKTPSVAYSTSYNVDISSIDLPSANENEITKTGYIFDGWYLKYNSKTKTYEDKIESLENLINKAGYKNVTLYAKWNPIHYSIEYHGEGVEPVIVNNLTYDVSFRLDQDVFKKAGQFVSKWTYTNASGKKTTVSGNASVKNLAIHDGDTVILTIAKDTKKHIELFSRATYTITYNMNGGTNSSKNKKSYTMGSSFLLENPSKKGYEFISWTDEEGNPVTSINTADFGNKVYTANWSVINYSITFNASEGTLPEDYESGSIDYTVEDSLTLQSPTRANHTFAGWYKGKTKVTSIKKGTTGNMNLTAKWTEGTNYTVVYDKNDPSVTGKMSTTKVSAGKNVTLTNNAYKLTGKVFVEWNTMADGTGLSFKNKDTLLKSAPLSMYGNETITLYAIWDDVYSFSIHFDANTGNGTMKSLSMSNKAYKALTANTFKKPGYSFAGWNSEPDGSGMSYKNKEVFWKYNKGGADVTLYAIWSLNTYRISYKNLKSTDINPNQTEYTIEGSDIELSNLTRSNYLFMGWYADSSFKKKVETISVNGCKNITLYAKWAAAKEIMEPDAYAYFEKSSYDKTKKEIVTAFKGFKYVTIKAMDNPAKAGQIQSISVNGVVNNYVGGLYVKATTKIVVTIYR